MAWVLRKSRIDHPGYCLLGFQPFCNFKRIFLSLLHADSQGFDSSKDQPAVKRRQPGTCCFDQKTKLLADILPVCHQKSSQGIVMSAQEFGSAVHHNVSSQIQRILEIRGQKCIVHNKKQIMSLRNVCQCCNVRYIHHRIGRSFNINCLCVLIHIAFHVFFPAVDPGKLKPVFRGNIVKKTNASSVQVCVHNQVISRLKQLHYQRNGCHSCGKGQRVDSVFQSCHDSFQVLSGWILQSAIVKACALSYCRVCVGCSLINGKTDGAVIVAAAFLFF